MSSNIGGEARRGGVTPGAILFERLQRHGIQIAVQLFDQRRWIGQPPTRDL